MKPVTQAKILMVDDTELNLRVLTSILRQAGFLHLRALQDPRQVLTTFDDFRPDLLLLDLMMPHMDGFSVMEQLKAHLPSDVYFPVLMLTADHSAETKRQALSVGIHDFLSKPFDASEVTLRIRNLLQTRVLHEEIREQNHLLERKVAERTAALKRSEERYALACTAANDGLWDWDLGDGSIYYSSRWKEILGYADNEIEGTTEEWFTKVHPEDLPYLRQIFDSLIENDADHMQYEYRMRHKDGTFRWVLTRGLSVRDSEGTLRRLAGSQSDITARKLAEEQLVHDAFHDALTGLANRALFMDRLSQRLSMLQRSHGHAFGVLFIDLNRFKIINDTLGHQAGDDILKATAQRLRTVTRSCDTVARLGGDEFTVLLEEVQHNEDVFAVAGRVFDEIAHPIKCLGQDLRVTASIGVVIGTEDYRTADDVLRDADVAMYQSKIQRNARFLVFDRSMKHSAPDLLKIERDLHRAMDHRELHLHYQPIVDLEENRISGFEALLRWQHPERGMIGPNDFIQVAEDTGQIFPIGVFVLREACEQIVRWQNMIADSALTMAVNVSPRQFNQPDIVLQIRDELKAAGAKPEQLILEITENTVMHNPDASITKLEHLDAVGIGLGIDDFGVGYSSLKYLQTFPVNHLKIDRSFVHRIEHRKKDYELVRLILLLAKNLGLHVVAEGVETAQQYQILKELGCKYAQGYFFSRPLPVIEATNFLLSPTALPHWPVPPPRPSLCVV